MGVTLVKSGVVTKSQIVVHQFNLRQSQSPGWMDGGQTAMSLAFPGTQQACSEFHDANLLNLHKWATRWTMGWNVGVGHLLGDVGWDNDRTLSVLWRQVSIKEPSLQEVQGRIDIVTQKLAAFDLEDNGSAEEHCLWAHLLGQVCHS